MRTTEGRAWFFTRLTNCGVYDNVFDSDPIEHAYAAGKRAAGLDLLREAQSEPDFYVKMIEESLDAT